jgi:integrase
VIELANEMQKRYIHGEGLAHVSANLGTRANESFIFTASPEVHRAGNGNYVDLSSEVVKVHWQGNGSKGAGKRVTKNNRFRAVVIPPVENIATGFDVYQWLKERSKEALLEQKAGTNPLALIFPSKTGQVWNPNYFNSSVMRPALDELGWKMPGNVDAGGKERFMYRFTLHSFRDRYGTTAADEWGYSERQLLEQGSWTDPETIRAFYLGTDDNTHTSVRNLHHSQSRFKKIQEAN